MRKTLQATLLTAALALLLSGCGLIAAFIPPLAVGDPFALNDASVKVTMAPAGAAVTAGSSVGTLASTGKIVNSWQVADMEIDLKGFGVGKYRQEAGMVDTLTVTLPDAGVYPETVTVSNVSLSVRLYDEANPTGVTIGDSFDGDLTFTMDGCTATDESCVYTYSSGEVDPKEVQLFLLEVTHQSDALIEILDQGGTNEIEVTIEMTTVSDPELAGSLVTLKLRADEATVQLK